MNFKINPLNIIHIAGLQYVGFSGMNFLLDNEPCKLYWSICYDNKLLKNNWWFSLIASKYNLN